MEWHKKDYLILSAMRMRKRHLFCTSSHHNVPYEKQKEPNNGSALKRVSLLERVCNCWISSTLVHTWAYHIEKISRRLFYIDRNWYCLWIELSGWMGSVLYGLGADLSLPVCLSVTIGMSTLKIKLNNLRSQKRPTERGLGGNRLVRRSGTTSRGTVVLVFCLRMRRYSLTLALTIFVGME